MKYLTRFTLLILSASLSLASGPAKSQRPNIVWIMAEDISTELECYGEPGVKTPILNGLAARGARYTHAFTTAPSCTPSRNAMITGVYQTRTDTQDQRRRGVTLKGGVKPITKLLREAGYYTALGCGYSGKLDLNFRAPRHELFEGNDWKHRKPGQPFFAQITINQTHRLAAKPKSKGALTWRSIREASEHPVDPSSILLPPYFPDTAETRLDWATYLDTIEFMDSRVGEILHRLEVEGIADDTVVIFIGDNGHCHLRGKCWLYDGGIRVPLIIHWPGKIESGEVVDDMVSMIDVSATILDIAGVEVPVWMDGHPILGTRAEKRDHIFAARDLVDEVMDHIRCVRDRQYKYIRNYTPANGYRECDYVYRHRPMWPVIQRLHEEGSLNETQQVLLAKTKPREELYDLEADPWEVNNLAESEKHQEIKLRLARLLDGWITATKDKGIEQINAAKTLDAADGR